MIVVAMLVVAVMEAWVYLILGAGIGLLFVHYNDGLTTGKKIAVVILFSIGTFIIGASYTFNNTLDSYNNNGTFESSPPEQSR